MTWIRSAGCSVSSMIRKLPRNNNHCSRKSMRIQPESTMPRRNLFVPVEMRFGLLIFQLILYAPPFRHLVRSRKSFLRSVHQLVFSTEINAVLCVPLVVITSKFLQESYRSFAPIEMNWYENLKVRLILTCVLTARPQDHRVIVFNLLCAWPLIRHFPWMRLGLDKVLLHHRWFPLWVQCTVLM